jgi:hypothetical protein
MWCKLEILLTDKTVTNKKDYAITVHESENLQFSQKDENIFAELKKKYGFSCNLNEWLNELSTWSKMWEEEYKLSPGSAKKKKYLLGLCKQIEKLLNNIEAGETIILIMQNELFKSSTLPSGP